MLRLRPAVLAVSVLLTAALLPMAPAAGTTPPIVPTHLPYPAGGTSAIGLGVDPANQNAQPADSVPATIKASWHAEPPLCPQAGGSTPSTISVAGSRTVVLDRQYQCAFLSEYNTSTGALIWRKQFGSGDFTGTAAVVGNLVYLEHENATEGTMLNAYDLVTGALRWTSYDGDSYGQLVNAFGSGLVTNEDWADDALTGAHRFTIPLAPQSSTDGTSFVAGNRMYYNADGDIQANSVTNGALLWNYVKSGTVVGPGAGNALPALHDGRLYVRAEYSSPTSTTLVLDPATGRLLRTLPASDQPIAFDGQVGIFSVTPNNQPTTISAVNLYDGHIYWRHTLPSAGPYVRPTQMETAPVLENGLLWILDRNNAGEVHLAALDEITGATRKIVVEPCWASAATGMLTVAQHRIFASSECGVFTYTG